MAQVPLDFQFDPSFSNGASVSGNVSGFSILAEQTPGSLTTGAQGHLNTVVADGGIEFPAGSVVNFKTLAAPQQPGIGGMSGSGPADFGFLLQVPFGSGRAAIRNLEFTITGAAQFDFSAFQGDIHNDQLTYTITSGTLDYSIDSSLSPPSREGSVSLAGLTGQFSGGAGRIVYPAQAPGTIALFLSYELTLPFSAVAPNDSRLVFRGGIITLPQVPEPGMLGLSLPALLWTLRRQARKRA